MAIGQGTRLGPYEVQDFIGQGAMGLVYRAYHAQLERVGAIKVMQAIAPDQDTVARFRHEAQSIARLRHPNIVDVYDFGEQQGTPYMIVEYIPGGSLATRMEHGPLDHARALRYLRGIAAGLDYAHLHDIVHRDVKPANVLLTNDDTPVLADFGLAKLLQGSSLKSLTGMTTGTPAYMAPEQVTGHQVGPAADRYSLATIAYEMLTGVIPFDGEGLMELLYAQVHRQPPAASSRNADLGPEVDAVLMQGLAKDPKARWESATAFVDALETALEARPVRVLAGTVVMASPVATVARPAEVEPFADAETSVAYPSPPPPAAPRKRPRRRLVAGLAALLVLLLLMGVWAVASQATTLAVNPNRTVPGGRVMVTATHVPANQVGEIQLWSALQTYFFVADSNGDVSQEIAIPADIGLGNHTIKICWGHACHEQTQLRVLSTIAEVVPTPVAGVSPSPSPSLSPSSSPRPNPTSTQTQTPPRQAALKAVPATTTGGSLVGLGGSNFSPVATVTLKYFAPSNSQTAYATWFGRAGSAGAFTTDITTKPASEPRTDIVVACDNGNPMRCAYTYITIVL